MSHDDAFLQSIIESPEDDAPRLVYADWLEERGDAARAEFIRVQCQRAGMDEEDPRQVGLLIRERALLKEHSRRWVGRLSDFTQHCEFRRGFVEQIDIGWQEFLTHATDIFAAA